MVKSRKKLAKFFVIAFLVLFPFGQLIGIPILNGFKLQPVDLVALSSIVIFDFKNLKNDWLQTIILILTFSFIFSLGLFPITNLSIGALYMVRIFSYISFYFAAKLSLNNSKFRTVLNILIGIAFIVSLLGLVQYFLLPDLRFLKAFGWDDHLGRLASTFLDPGFTGIILTFGFILTIFAYFKFSKVKFIFLSLLFFITTVLTYSRASILALSISAFLVFWFNKKYKLILVGIAILTVSLFFSPKFSSEGTDLARTKSIFARLTNYEQSIELFKRSPVFGIGYDNLCLAKETFLSSDKLGSHSCSGFDSSFLSLFVYFGVVGVLLFASQLIRLKDLNLKQFEHQILFVTLIALLIHSQFNNSLFYPWVLGWMAILFAVCLRRKIYS